MKNEGDQFLDTSWLHELCNHSVLGAEEEIDLVRRCQENGDIKARNRLVRHNQRLVLRVVVGLVPQAIIRKIGILVLMNVGNEGLMWAIDKFEITRKVRLSTYASFWIRSFVRRFSFRQQTVLTMSEQVLRRRRKQMRFEDKRIVREGGHPDLGDAGYREAAVTWALCTPADLFGECRADDDASLLLVDTVSGDEPTVEERVGDGLRRAAVRRRWQQARLRLTPREICIVEKRLMADGEDALTLQEIGDRFEVTRERIRQNEAKLKVRLRELFEEFA